MIPFMKFKYKYVYMYLRNPHMWLSLDVKISIKIFSSLSLWYFLIFYDEYSHRHTTVRIRKKIILKRASCF